MTFIRHSLLFFKSNLKTLQRKLPVLPLLLLFPVILVSLMAVIAISIIQPDEDEPLRVGLVDLDKSQETEMVIELIESSSQTGNYIKMEALTEEQAREQINEQLSAYVSFPKGFTESLYNGDSVTLEVTGNAGRRTESYLVKELLDSLARHIRTSQANILTIDDYLKPLPIADDKRKDILVQQFKDFLIYTAGKDKLLSEEQITNQATSSPVHYYGLAAWFIIITIWLLAFYSFFSNDDGIRMQNRMRLYGVTVLQQLTAKITATCLITSVLGAISFYLYVSIMAIPLYSEDYIRIALLTLLYCLIYLGILAMLETIFTGHKIRLLMQSLLTLLVLLASGAIIPTLYFPLYMQHLLPYLFASEGFRWLQEIILNGRFYADYIPMTLMLLCTVMILIGTSVWKERAVK
ncbi:hypothetical protein GCM10008983_13660 [Lentibacillus halophilus]|uniref:ABC-2 type transporter transmembrane domain-containing protein n=1 Tax=Lentibacillus halophilus TaxID=295065 RepID=A0ABP3J1Z2_9BACI